MIEHLIQIRKRIINLAPHYIFLAICVFAALIWLPNIGLNDLGDGTAGEVLYARESLGNIFLHPKWADQSPLYFVLLKTWKIFPETPFFTRVFFLVCQLLCAFLLYKIAGLFFKKSSVALMAVFLFVINAFSYQRVNEGRMHTVCAMFSLISIYFLIRYLDKNKIRHLFGFVIASALNIYSNFIGFYIGFLLFVFWAGDIAVQAIKNRTHKNKRPGFLRLSAPLFLSGLALSLLSLPQILRVYALLGKSLPTFRIGWSVGNNPLDLVYNVCQHLFIHTHWGFLRSHTSVLNNSCFFILGLFFFVGFWKSPARMKWLAFVWTALAVGILCFYAKKLDFRPRYFAFIYPIVMLLTANGFAWSGPKFRNKLFKHLFKLTKYTLVVLLVLMMLFLHFNKLKDKYPRVSETLRQINKVYKTGEATIYFSPDYAIFVPQFAVDWNKLNPKLREIIIPSQGNRNLFLKEVNLNRSFIFLIQGNSETDEMRWRRKHLLGRGGYQQLVYSSYQTKAYVFLRQAGPAKTLFEEGKIENAGEGINIALWCLQKTRLLPKLESKNILDQAIVAKINSEGNFIKSNLKLADSPSQISWILGDNAWEYVGDFEAIAGGIAKKVIWAHPVENQTLAICFPNLMLKKTLEVDYGIADSGLWFKEGAPIKFDIYIDSSKVGSGIAHNESGWKNLFIDTGLYTDQKHAVTFLIKTKKETARHFSFSIKTRSLADNRQNSETRAIELSKEKPISHQIERLKILRIESSNNAQTSQLYDIFQGSRLSSDDMHEKAGRGEEGGVGKRWMLEGGLNWECVGETLIRSAGLLKRGLWAHPKKGTTLIIEAANVAITKGGLEGFYGFSDYSIEQAKKIKVSAPVLFKIFVNSELKLTRSIPRESGWKPFQIPVDASTKKLDNVRIEISADSDRWAHFVFDLW